PSPAVPLQSVDHPIGFSDLVVQALIRSFDYSLFFGQPDIEPVHLLLALIDLPDATSTKLFDDLGANLTFLRREILHMMAAELSVYRELPGMRNSMVSGLKELIDRSYTSVRSLQALAHRSGLRINNLPGRAEIVHRVCVAYFSDFLWSQVASRRYLLEESLD
ncbi:MAG TPA: Clp protease N-terminal domain-containing protein, partial [Candidatus Melainabacteria bacterium]|nr:Clp protease N-terminal domain-containing protein [Candidatus Melainabacteria bacterium]